MGGDKEHRHRVSIRGWSARSAARPAAELVDLKVDVILASTAATAMAAKNATSTIPIVMAIGGDPVALGLVASLARPGGNVTGLSYGVGLETFGKALELLKEAVPTARRMAVLFNPDQPAHALALKAVQAAAQSLGVELQLVEARGLNEFDRAFAVMGEKRAGALLVEPDPILALMEDNSPTLPRRAACRRCMD